MPTVPAETHRPPQAMHRPIRVLIVDDSPLVREILTKGLAGDPHLEVVGVAEDAIEAQKMIEMTSPDVMTLDVEMPKLDGVSFLRMLMPIRPLPVVMVSALTERGQKITLDALEAGAVDFVTKPTGDLATGLADMMMELRTKVKIASVANVSHWKHRRSQVPVPAPGKVSKAQPSMAPTEWVIAIGASTGGTEAIREVVCGLPQDVPGVVIVQHMPAGFTTLYAKRLNEDCALEVKEAQDGDMVLQGRVLLAPGAHHMQLIRTGAHYQVRVFKGEKVNGHCPSVEVLMRSVAKLAGKRAVGVMLTGMGGDGSEGLLAMRQAGARTLAQDEASCVVFGMPKVAWEKGAVEKLMPLQALAHEITELYNK